MAVEPQIQAPEEKKVPAGDPRREPLVNYPIYPVNRSSRWLGRVRSVREEPRRGWEERCHCP